MRPIRVLIADDQTIVRRGTRALLNQVDDVEVVGEAANGAEAITLAQRLQPDVILMDLVMPEVDGIAATERIVTDNPSARVIALTSFGSDDKLLPTIRAGALGYLLKDADTESLLQAIRRVAGGEAWLPADIARRVLDEMRNPASPPSAVNTLTDREREVLRLLAMGKTNGQIATCLTITDATVRTHLAHIMDKLQCTNRVQAVLYALRVGIASLDDTHQDQTNQQKADDICR